MKNSDVSFFTLAILLVFAISLNWPLPLRLALIGNSVLVLVQVVCRILDHWRREQ